MKSWQTKKAYIRAYYSEILQKEFHISRYEADELKTRIYEYWMNKNGWKVDIAHYRVHELLNAALLIAADQVCEGLDFEHDRFRCVTERSRMSVKELRAFLKSQ